MNIGKKIKIIRELRNMSQENFAESLGYSQGYIADVETGRTKPSRKLLEALSLEYGESIAWLFLPEKYSDLWGSTRKYIELGGIIFLYAFTQKGLKRAERLIKNALKNDKYIFVDVSQSKNVNEFLRKLVKKKGNNEKLLEEIGQMIYSEKITMIIIKNVSRSKIPNFASWINNIHSIIWETCCMVRESIEEAPTTILVLLDFPSYLEKHFRYFRHYMNVRPIYMGDAIGSEEK